MLNSPASDLKTVLRLAFNEPLTWVSKAPQTEVSVQWATASLEEARSGDVLLWPAKSVNDQILQHAVQRAVAIVLLVGDQPVKVKAMPEGLLVAQIAIEGGVRAAQQLLFTILVNRRVALMERGVRVHAQLSQLAAEGKGLEGLVQAIADISGRGVLVQDKRLGILADCPSGTLASIWQDVLQQIHTPNVLPEEWRDRKSAGRQPGILTQSIPGGLERLVSPIVVGEIARGYLSLVGLPGEMDILDHLVIEQGVLVCAIEMARAKAVRETEKRLKGDLLTALLQQELSPRDTLLWVQNMGFDLTQVHTTLRFAWDSASPPSRRRLETIINGEVSRLGLHAIVNALGSEVICICQEPPTARPSLALEFAQAVADQAARERPDHPLRCGVGTPARDLSAWRVSFSQAGQALEMARRFGERKPLYFTDLSVYRLLLQIEHNPEMIAFQEEVLGALIAHENSMELMRTLEAYFEHNGNLSQTAEAMYIHRNTLLYRMERIAEITKMDLNDPENRLALQLALRIQRMTGPRIT